MKKKEKCLKVEESLVLDIDHLLKGIDRSKVVDTYLTGRQRDGSHLTLQLKLNGYEKWIRVVYQNADEEDKDGVAEYYIIIEAIPSNLGRRKGENLYFICPISSKRCKKLYLAGDSLVLQHRTAYNQGLRYPSQYLSKGDRIEYRTQKLDLLVKEQSQSCHKSHYRGQKTTKQRRLDMLEYRSFRATAQRLRGITEEYNRTIQKINFKLQSKSGLESFDKHWRI